VLPVACPMSGAPEWSDCNDLPMCRDTCSAIRTGRPYRHDLARQCLPGPQGH
jgi:hypothetical protein